MAISLARSAENLCGLSTDDKPTSVDVNTLFMELDTGDFYYFNGTEWGKVGSGSSSAVESDLKSNPFGGER